MFADDTTLFFSHRNIEQLQQIYNSELENVSNWLKANKLSLNTKKTNILLFRTVKKQLPNDFTLRVNGVLIKEKSCAKYLGVLIDNKLSFYEHCNHVCNKLVKGNAILSKIKYFVPHKVLRNVYFARIQPHMDYGITTWGFGCKTYLQSIQKLQRKSIRLFNLKPRRFPTKALFFDNKILPLHNILRFKNGCLLWKASHNALPSNLNALFRKTHTRFFKPFRRLKLTQANITYAGVKFWNHTPHEIREQSTFSAFKKKLKKYLLEH